jgi:hypothetical protein
MDHNITLLLLLYILIGTFIICKIHYKEKFKISSPNVHGSNVHRSNVHRNPGVKPFSPQYFNKQMNLYGKSYPYKHLHNSYPWNRRYHNYYDYNNYWLGYPNWWWPTIWYNYDFSNVDNDINFCYENKICKNPTSLQDIIDCFPETKDWKIDDEKWKNIIPCN